MTFMNQFRLRRRLFWICFAMLSPLALKAQSSGKLKDFRGTSQTAAMLGAFSEFIDPEYKLRVVAQSRKLINKYTRSFGDSSISNFKLALNPNDQYFRPITGVISENQKQYLKSAQKDNSVDIFVLGSLTEVGDGLEFEVQLYDVRIETLSAVEKVVFKRGQEERALEDLIYRLMTYLDREGFVHPNVQDVLEPPSALKNTNLLGSANVSTKEFSINPEELSGAGILAGRAAIGGEKTPFWETWWFWTIIGSTVAFSGGLTYYLTVVDEPPSRGNIRFVPPQ